MSQWLLLDFTCPVHGQFESLVDKREGGIPDEIGCPADEYECDEDCPRVTSYAVRGKIKLGEVTQGKNSDSDRPSHILDTRDLGDGMSLTEWEAKNDIKDQDQRWKDVKEMRQ